MADTKLFANSIMAVIPSDDHDIPNFSGPSESGTTTATTASKLVNSAATFESSGITTGAIIYNTTNSTSTTVTAVDSDTTLSVADDIFASDEDYVLYTEKVKDVALYIGGAGTLKVDASGAGTETFTGMLPGMFVPVNVKKVYATGTSATLIIALI